MFGKYRICRVLGKGHSGVVFLAMHIGLEEYRAIKRVSKEGEQYEKFRREAFVLKQLRHLGIPIIYDLEEDDQYGYLVEEFLEGDSIFALISKEGHFSEAMTLLYGIQICHLVSFLHLAKPTPILYLDLQPKNLLVCQNTVKLVDFGQAHYGKEAIYNRYGTVGYAAPEQYTEELLDERTDIYAIGAVLFYMLTGEHPKSKMHILRGKRKNKLWKIMDACFQQDKNKRIQTVTQLCEQLEQILKERNLSSLTIAVAGVKSGVGTTHIAMGLSVYLKNQGIHALYEEKNESGAIYQWLSRSKYQLDSYGIIKVKGIPMLMKFGDAVCLKQHTYTWIIQDYGTRWEDVLGANADIVVLVCTGKSWDFRFNQAAYEALKEFPQLILVCNHFLKEIPSCIVGMNPKTSVLQAPYFLNPWNQEKQVVCFYQKILSSLEKGVFKKTLFGNIKLLLLRRFRGK